MGVVTLVIAGCMLSKPPESKQASYTIQKIIQENHTESLDEVEASPEITVELEKTKPDTKPVIPYTDKDYQSILNNIGNVSNVDETESVDSKTVSLINSMPARSTVKVLTVNAATLSACFFSCPITKEIFSRMQGKSFGENCTTDIDSLRYVRVLHYGFDGEIHIGELVVSEKIEEDIIAIFKELFDLKYPIEQMVLIDEYNGDDTLSMEANNTSSFNFRVVDGTSTLSKHAYGLAIDINPLYNPYVKTINDEVIVAPENGREYVNRSLDCNYYIRRDDAIYTAFISRGFTWGGDWNSAKDYQHFQKVFE